MSNQITVNDFKWIKGENDQEYIKLLLDTLDRQKKITAKAVAKVKELQEQNSPSQMSGTSEDVVSRNAIILKLNTMDRYVSEELRLCDTEKRFPKNEVFIVDDVYEEIAENLPSVQSELEDKIRAIGYTGKEGRIYIGGRLFAVRELPQ